MVFNDSIATYCDILTVQCTHHADQLFISGVLQTSKNDLTFSVVADNDIALGWALGESEI